MKVFHIISSIDKKGGGTSTYLQLLGNSLCKKIELGIVSIDSDEKLALDNAIETHFLKTTFPFIQAYSSALLKTLKTVSCDIFHGNGLWQYPTHLMVLTAKKRQIPYIISPHGMLEPWALNQGRLKKEIILRLFQKSDVAKANCIHATAEMEAENLHKLGFKNPIAVIPNGIDINDFPLKEFAPNNKKTLLFLSRIHPKKGIELLIEAWSTLDKNIKTGWCVEIAGNGTIEYIAQLQQLIASKNLLAEIKIIGSQFGPHKLATYHRADLFVLPTYSENFGIVVAEALACGVPVITTKGAPWDDLIATNSGWWIDIGVEPLRIALEEALTLSEYQRIEMGKNGRKLVENKYSVEAVAEQMIQLYQWILKKGEKPEFIY